MSIEEQARRVALERADPDTRRRAQRRMSAGGQWMRPDIDALSRLRLLEHEALMELLQGREA